MRKIKEVLRLHAAGLSAQAISESLRISHSTVNDYVRRIKAAQLSWPLPACWADADLEAQPLGHSAEWCPLVRVHEGLPFTPGAPGLKCA